jgi:hypothetical protein
MTASSQTDPVKADRDVSYDIDFGPKAPATQENNEIQTVPGRGWSVILRLYGPLEPWFDKLAFPGRLWTSPQLSYLRLQEVEQLLQSHIIHGLYQFDSVLAPAILHTDRILAIISRSTRRCADSRGLLEEARRRN